MTLTIHTTPHSPHHCTATVRYPSGRIVVYGPMRSSAYSLLHARAQRLGHQWGAESESVAHELQEAVRLGMIRAHTIAPGVPAAQRREAELSAHPGDLAGWAESIQR